MFGYKLIREDEMAALKGEVSVLQTTVSKLRQEIQNEVSQKNICMRSLSDTTAELKELRENYDHVLEENKLLTNTNKIQNDVIQNYDIRFKNLNTLVAKLEALWIARKDNPKTGPRDRKANTDAIDATVDLLKKV